MGMIWSRFGVVVLCQSLFVTGCGPKTKPQKPGPDPQENSNHLSEQNAPDATNDFGLSPAEQLPTSKSKDKIIDDPDPIGGSPGCNIPGRDLGVKNVSIRVGSSSRSFIRVINSKYDPKHRHTLVIGFHGYGLDGSSPRTHHKWTQIEDTAGDEAIFIYPNALGGSWNGGSGSSPDVIFFDEIVRTTSELYCIDKNRIFVHGFSNGGFFVNSLAWHRSSAIRAVIAVAGGGGGAKIPAMVIHGTSDSNVGFYFGQQSISAYAKANGCGNVNFGAIKMGECQQVPNCQAEYPTWFCPWGGNHHWPEFSLSSVWGFVSSFK